MTICWGDVPDGSALFKVVGYVNDIGLKHELWISLDPNELELFQVSISRIVFVGKIGKHGLHRCHCSEIKSIRKKVRLRNKSAVELSNHACYVHPIPPLRSKTILYLFSLITSTPKFPYGPSIRMDISAFCWASLYKANVQFPASRMCSET